jgi:tetratricopeptide (TPR) repeat protein
LIFVTALALIAGTADFTSWMWWKQVSKSLIHRPEIGARLLASHPLLSLPSSVECSRRLVARDLGTASRGAVEAALARLGELQTRWLPADSVGYLNLARVAMLRGRNNTAIELFESALIRDVTSPYHHRMQALVFLEMGRLEEALTRLAIAEALAPGLRSPPLELTPMDADRA